jgi:hypothetical protein
LPGVGNDVVDLQEPGNRGKSRDERFLARVFTTDERELITRAAAPDTLLWVLWAAKEAAYKAVSGGDPAVCSIPRRYPVHIETSALFGNRDPLARWTFFNPAPPRSAAKTELALKRSDTVFAPASLPGQGSPKNLQCALPGSDFQRSHLGGKAGGLLTGRVVTPLGEIALRITVTDDYVHAIAAEFDADVTGIIQRVDRREGGGNPGDPSVFVRRQLLAEISRRLNCSIDELTVRNDPSGSGAPHVFRGDRPLSLEISLSHDGRFTAFAFLLR